MSTMTDEEAEAARIALAAHDAAKAEEARQAENDRRAAARAAFAPLTEIVPDLTAVVDQIEAVLNGGLGEETGLTTLSGNAAIVLKSLLARIERRTADTEPVPEPAEPSVQ